MINLIIGSRHKILTYNWSFPSRCIDRSTLFHPKLITLSKIKIGLI